MSSPHRTRASLADVAAVAVALDQDQQRKQADRDTLDRRLARGIAVTKNKRRSAGLAWLDAMRHEDPQLEALHAKVNLTIGWAHTLLIAAGLGMGWLAALGALYYDGSHRINVVTLLGVLVVLPGLFLIAFIIAALPRHWIEKIPGAAALGLFSHSVSPGRLVLFLRRWLPPDVKSAWDTIAGSARSHQTLYARVQKWAVLRGSQLFALGFQAAALSAALALVVFTDLAFGWSTTLSSGDAVRDAERVHGITSTLAEPWSGFAPAGKPSAELVAESRYYRAASETIDPSLAARLGGWWPFVALALLLYGLLPRVVTSIFCHHRARSAADAALETTPGLTAVLNRLHRAHLGTVAHEADPPETKDNVDPNQPAIDQPAPPGTTGAVINWAGLPLTDEALASHFDHADVFQAGGSAGLAEDRATIERGATARPAEEAAGIVVVVKAWEPPLLELIDFLRELRSALGPGRMILAMPLAVENDAPAPPPAESVMIWEKKLKAMGDPWLSVQPFREEETA